MRASNVQKLFVGKVKKMGDPDASNWMEQPWESGIFKNSVYERIWLSKTGLTGDEVADTKNHGGPEKAIFAYPTIHYDFWKEELDLQEMRMGAMGENIAVHSMDEHSVCIGDTYQFCDAVIQVSQPRQPCWKPARRFKMLDFALHIQRSGRTGWYFRVLKEGFVQGEREMTLLERPYPQWTIAKCNEVMHVKTDDLKLAKDLYTCAFLAENWKQTLLKRLAGEKSSIDKRVYGPNKD
ncbi:MOSC domain-containing protein [Bacillus benzoevorans]|uniref:MOSC domain-containing protein YiiM n=1 Tax=Bacillus benzoevorans TaxID=1456 RepID=A0A7X0LW05_9BACI|nr:MOSC domain-containing protein [Bacillus benzoevorans]MBB6444824.1 MOSC domain-containing protein YiiM [Bacillus benzoevorans]